MLGSDKEKRRDDHRGSSLHDPNNLFPSEEDMTSLLNSSRSKSYPVYLTKDGGSGGTGDSPMKSNYHSFNSTSMLDTPLQSPTSSTQSMSPLFNNNNNNNNSKAASTSSSANNSPMNHHSFNVNSPTKKSTKKTLHTHEWNGEFSGNNENKLQEKYQLRASGLGTRNEEMTLGERLHRYAKISIAESQITPWCDDKQINDKLERNGKTISVKAPEPVINGMDPILDPTKHRITRLQKNREISDQTKAKSITKKMFSQIAHSIPDVSYNPLTALQLMKSSESHVLFLRAADVGSPINVYTTEDIQKKHAQEREFVYALQRARQGDKRALVDYYMSKGGNDDEDNDNTAAADFDDGYDNDDNHKDRDGDEGGFDGEGSGEEYYHPGDVVGAFESYEEDDDDVDVMMSN